MIILKKKIIISIMGVDGVGKTTLAKNLHKSIKKSEYLHFKPYILFLDRRTVIKNPQHKMRSSRVISFLRLLSWLVSYKIFFLKKKLKKIYIFDRYAHDVIVDPLRYRQNLPLKLTTIILNFFPKPDLWIFLNSSLKTIKSRKLELSDKELRRQIREYNKFFKNKKNVIMLNSNIKKKKLTNKILKKIMFLTK